MRFYSPFQKVLVLTCVLVFAASCGGGSANKGPSPVGGGTASLSACPTTATPGEQILCAKPDNFTSDSQCFLDQGQRELFVDCQETDKGLQVTLPALAGKGDLIFRQGSAGPFVIQKGITIAPASASASAPAASGGQPVTPTESTVNCLSDSDCASGRICDKTSGTCVASGTPSPSGSGSTGTTSPTTGTPQELKVTLEAQEETKTRLGLYTFTFHVEGGQGLKSVALVGPWNRSDKDTNCGDDKTASWLTVNPAKSGGGDFGPLPTPPAQPSTNFQEAESKGLTTGKPCVNANDCYQGFSPPAAGAPAAPTCLMNPVDANGKPLAAGDFASRLLVANGKFVIVATDEAGTTKTAELTLTPDIPTVDAAVSLSYNEPKVLLQATYTGVSSVPAVTGCPSIQYTLNSLSKDGSGTLSATCLLSTNMTIGIAASGLDPKNAVSHTFSVVLHKPAVTLNEGGGTCSGTGAANDPDNCDYPGTINFHPTVSRTYDIQKDGVSVKPAASKEVVWVDSLSVYAATDPSSVRTTTANKSMAKKTLFTPNYKPQSAPWILKEEVTKKNGNGEFVADRDYGHTGWVAVAKDYDGKTYQSDPVSHPYNPSFSISPSPLSPTLNLKDTHSCFDGSSSIAWSWSGQHLSYFAYHCEIATYDRLALGGEKTPDIDIIVYSKWDKPDPKNYGPQSGILSTDIPVPSANITDDGIRNKYWSDWKQDFSCQFWAVYYDGTRVEVSIPHKQWECSCYEDGPDGKATGSGNGLQTKRNPNFEPPAQCAWQ